MTARQFVYSSVSVLRLASASRYSFCVYVLENFSSSVQSRMTSRPEAAAPAGSARTRARVTKNVRMQPFTLAM
jgi:hypothetical protein